MTSLDRAMRSDVDVTVVIVSRNRARQLRGTIESVLRDMSTTGLSVDLLLVDNGSTDETSDVIAAAALEDNRVSSLLTDQPGKSRALNVAVGVARGEVLLFTDDDVRVPVGWIEQMSAPIRNGDADAVGGNITMAEHLRRPWMTEQHEHLFACFSFSPGKGGGLIGANMAVRRTAFERLRYDERLGPGALGFADDLLLQVQALHYGFRIANIGVAVVHHFDESRLTRAALLDHLLRNGSSTAYVYWHWLHSRQRMPRARLAVASLDLLWWRLRHRRASANPPCPAEMDRVWSVGFKRQYLRECRRDAIYKPSR